MAQYETGCRALSVNRKTCQS